MDLTAEQRTAIEAGEPVPYVVGRTECVVLRKDVFERMQQVAYDDGDWTEEEMLSLAQRTFADADAAGPIP